MKASKNSYCPRVEELENRLVPANLTGVKVTPAGALRIVGTQLDDKVTVHEKNGQLIIVNKICNGNTLVKKETIPLARANVTARWIMFEGRNGADSFQYFCPHKQPLRVLAFGQGGSDTLFGAGFNDLLDGGDGIDWLYGLGGNDKLLGGANRDFLRGEAGNDQLFGGTGPDSLNGGTGNDFLDGGDLDGWSDTLSGSRGADIFSSDWEIRHGKPVNIDYPADPHENPRDYIVDMGWLERDTQQEFYRIRDQLLAHP